MAKTTITLIEQHLFKDKHLREIPGAVRYSLDEMVSKTNSDINKILKQLGGYTNEAKEARIYSKFTDNKIRSKIVFNNHEFWLHRGIKVQVDANTEEYRFKISHIRARSEDDQLYFKVRFMNGKLVGEPQTISTSGGFTKIFEIFKPIIARLADCVLPGLGFVVALMAVEIGKAIEKAVVGKWQDVPSMILLEIMRQLALNYAYLDRTVFDPAFYLDVNKDVADAYGATNYEKAKEHWLRYGIREGRRSSSAFSIGWYLQRNPDLMEAFGPSDCRKALEYWVTEGINQGHRTCYEFDAKWYLAVHTGVALLHGENNYRAAIIDWLDKGLKEGKQSSIDFNINFYLSSNFDLVQAFGLANYPAAFTHWLNHGLYEKRKTNVTGVDRILFDPVYYLAVHKDVAKAYGATNYEKAKEHWFEHGIREGRRSSYEFDAAWYLNNHAELKGYRAVKDYNAAVFHWIGEGIMMGWQSSPDFDVRFYFKDDPKLLKDLGENNYMAAFHHWVYYGKSEGRKTLPASSTVDSIPPYMKEPPIIDRIDPVKPDIYGWPPSVEIIPRRPDRPGFLTGPIGPIGPVKKLPVKRKK